MMMCEGERAYLANDDRPRGTIPAIAIRVPRFPPPSPPLFLHQQQPSGFRLVSCRAACPPRSSRAHTTPTQTQADASSVSLV